MEIKRGKFYVSELDGKWEGVEEVNKPMLVIGIPCLRVDLIALGTLTKDKVPLRRQLRAQMWEESNLMGYYIGIGFGSVLWG